MDEKEEKALLQRVTVAEQSVKSAHHRLDGVEDLTKSIHTIAVEMKAMRQDLNGATKRIDEIEKRPVKRYETVITAVITAVVGIVLGYFLNGGI